MNKFEPVERCKYCKKPIRDSKRNKSGYCSNCGAKKYNNGHKDKIRVYQKRYREKMKKIKKDLNNPLNSE